MRILFVDFDGVLHGASATGRDEFFRWAPILASLLNGHEDVRLVVHSPWRYEFTDAELRKLLGPVGRWFARSTPRIRRTLAIQFVLEENRETLVSHLVIDHDEREFESGVLNIVFCDSNVGISDVNVQRAIATWLNSTAPGKDGECARDDRSCT